MPTVQVPARLTVEHLMAAVKQLSPAEWREFQQQLAAWQAQNGVREATEADLVACIHDNSRLPAVTQRRFNRLRRKRQAETLTPAEAKELQMLWQRVEAMNVTRLEALTTLAQRRGTDVRTLMRDLGVTDNLSAF
jgi:uncharacterized protein (DUF2236 family)